MLTRCKNVKDKSQTVVLDIVTIGVREPAQSYITEVISADLERWTTLKPKDQTLNQQYTLSGYSRIHPL